MSFTMQFPRTVEAVNREVARRRESGEAASDAQVVDFALAPLQHPDGSLSLRCVFTLSDGTTFALDTIERFTVDEIRGFNSKRLH